MATVRRDGWAKGANNIARPERLPDGFVRELVNYDPCEGGQLQLRSGYKQVVAARDMRLAAALPGRVIYVDESAIGCYWTDTDSSEVIGRVSSDGVLSGAVLNGQVYISGMTDSVRTDGRTVKPWAVHAPGVNVEVIEGALPAGIYKVAVTALGEDGEESGAEPVLLRLSHGKALRVTSQDDRPLRVYASVADAETLYSQGPLIGGAMALTQIDDAGARLTTTGLMPLPACSQLASHRSLLVGASGRYVVFTEPMMPHLMNPISGYLEYPEPVRVIAPTAGGVYVVADRTYFITGMDTPTPTQTAVLELGAVSGGSALLPDGRAAWFTRYGLAIGSAAGEVSLPNRSTYAPDTASAGAMGILENNGTPLVVATMHGMPNPNNLAVGDFADLEIL